MVIILIRYRQMENSLESPEDITPERNASSNVALESVIFMLIIPVFILDQLRKKHGGSQDAKRTKCLMMAVLSSNTLLQFLRIIGATVCANCNISYAVILDIRVLSRGINQLFLIHRAKVVQGIAPILSKKWFEKILPGIVTAVTLVGMFFTAQSATGYEFNCISYTDSRVLHFCWNTNDQHFDDEQKMYTVAFPLTLDLIWTTCFLTLFVVPLYRVYQLDLGIMNDNQWRQRNKLKRLLFWSVALTFLNQVTSTLYLLRVIYRSPTTMAMYMIGRFDPPINVWTSWFMVTRNRQYLQQIACCHWSRDSADGLAQAQSELNDIGSKSGRNSGHNPQNNICPEIPVPSMILPPIEMAST